MEAKEEIKMLRSILMDFMNFHKIERERLDKLETEIAILRGERRAGTNSGAAHTSTPRKNAHMKILKKE